MDVDLPDGDPASVQRRAPFSENPRVGARGQRAQQRILDAALQVFGEDGYHECGISRITEVAGCSRVAFYQYFSSKEDVFRHLAGRVARLLSDSAAALGPITPDAAGWATLRAWVGRQGAIYAAHQPVFLAFQAAARSDEAVASGAVRIQDRHVAMVRAALPRTAVPPRQLDAVVGLLLECLTRARHLTGVLRAALPEGALPDDRLDEALTDWWHRTLFGVDAAVNVHPAGPRLPAIPMGQTLAQEVQVGDGAPTLTATGARTRAALLAAAHDVLISRGYHGTRVDDVVAAAGVSHGTFYRYFENKDHVVRVLGTQAMQDVSQALGEVPPFPADGDESALKALRRWLRRYNATQSADTAMMRVWIDAATADPDLHRESAAAIDWGRRSLVRFLSPRGFGDVEVDTILLVTLFDAFGAMGPAPGAVAVATHVIERGLLGRP